MSLTWDGAWRTGWERVSRLRETRIRRMVYGIGAATLALLCLFPQPYVARAKLLPLGGGDSLSSLLGSMGGGIQNFASLIGNHQSIEVYLAVGRSHDVLADAAQRLRRRGVPDFSGLDPGEAEVRLASKVDVNALAGGIVEIDAREFDPSLALEVANAYADALRERLLTLARQHIVQKKLLLADRADSANARLAKAEDLLNRFQATHKLAAPPAQLAAAVEQQAMLNASLQGKLTELSAASRFGTGKNVQVMAIESEIASLRSEIARSEADSHQPGASNLTGMSLISTQYIDLYRDVQFGHALVEAYARFGEQIAAEDISTTADANVQIVEAPNVDPRRQYNIVAVGLLLALGVLAFYTELYVPLTQAGEGRAVGS